MSGQAINLNLVGTFYRYFSRVSSSSCWNKAEGQATRGTPNEPEGLFLRWVN